MENNPLSIEAINKYLKHKFDNDINLQNIYLRGEISNFKSQNLRGHLYFSLKDEKSKINVVMFSSSSNKLDFVPEDGMTVLVRGKISVYEQSGAYQIYINEMTPEGMGNLHLAFEKLKNKLDELGLFLDVHKKEIPKYPKKIGIVTASTGAAIKDILTTLKRRYPLAETIVFPCLVQGNKAASDIASNIEKAQNYNLDVLIVGRGGGSIEDLWSFNEEIVARAIFDSDVPIISAVGHEIDFTIADFVADLRAPTPTAAAELATPNIIDELNKINNVKKNISNYIKNKLNNYESILNRIKGSYMLVNPLNLYSSKEVYLDSMIEKLNNNINIKIDSYNNKLNIIKQSHILKNPENIYILKEKKLISMIEKIEVLNPMSTLKRGYSIIKKDNVCIDDVSSLKVNDKIEVLVNKASIMADITSIEMEK